MTRPWPDLEGAAVAPGARPWWMRRLSDPKVQAWAARFPLTRRLVRREGEAIFDLVAGFAQSQVLAALVELGVLERLGAWTDAGDLAADVGVPEDRARVLLRAGTAIGLIRMRRGRFRVSTRGAALLGVPGLTRMIRHHRVFYGDLSDPAGFFRGEVETDLKAFWPYVFGGGDAAVAARYSGLMADSLGPLADETLDAVDLRGVGRLLDLGGGTGAFAGRVKARYPGMDVSVADLPDVLSGADLPQGVTGVPVDFRRDLLPEGAEAISLVRVLYDHSDETVLPLMSGVRDALPPGGRVIVSEPMTGGDRPSRAGDVYFALYCLAMETGRARSPEEVSALLTQAGFVGVKVRRTRQDFVTTVVEARRDHMAVQDI